MSSRYCAYCLDRTSFAAESILDINTRNNVLLVSDDDSSVGLCSLAVASGSSVTHKIL